MKNTILTILLLIPVFIVYSQSPAAEKQYIDSLLKTGKLTPNQVIQIQNQWNTLSYQEFKLNSRTGEIEIQDTLTFGELDKKVIFQRCLEWIAINYGNLLYKDFDSGKIIASGLTDIDHYTESLAAYFGVRIQPVQTPVNYTMVLTIKENKIKYAITNILYNFKNFSETVDEISYPITLLFSVRNTNLHWIRFVTVLNKSIDIFNISLKNSLEAYIKDVGEDYNF
jgi:hypothetical protein